MNKKVLVTGGTCDLGRELVKLYASLGYDVIFTYFTNEEKALKIVKECSNDNIFVEAKKLNIRVEDDIKKLIKGLNRLDILINVAAYNYDNDIFEKDSQNFLKTLNTNLIGPFLLMKYSRDLLKGSNGCIVNVASTNGIDTMYSMSADYDASKAGLINLTKNMASAFAPNVRVNAVAPGWINTDSTVDINPKIKDSEIKKIALGRFAEPVEIAKVIRFLTSEDASYINGAVIRVDGGVNYEL